MCLFEFCCNAFEYSKIVQIKENEAAGVHGLCGSKSIDRGRNRRICGFTYGISECSRRDRRERHGGQPEFIRDADRLPVATRQRFCLALIAAAKDRPDGVNHMLRTKVPASGDHGSPSWKPSNLADDLSAFGKDRRATRVVDGAVDSAPTEKRRIGRVDDCVSCFLRDVGRSVDFQGFSAVKQEPHGHSLDPGNIGTQHCRRESVRSSAAKPMFSGTLVRRGPKPRPFEARPSSYFLSVSASTPGSFCPSRNSSEAPPPVEM